MKVTIETQTTAESRMVAKMVEIIEKAKPVYIHSDHGDMKGMLLHQDMNGICVVSYDDGNNIEILTVSGDKISPSADNSFIPVTLENFSDQCRTRKIGDSVYSICQNDNGNWYIMERWNDGAGFSQGRSNSSEDLGEILFIFNHLDREHMFAN